MPLPSRATTDFQKLCATYARAKIEFPQLKAVSLAQWALETGWGTSRLAVVFHNYGGAKWRPYMQPFAQKVWYEAHDGGENYCHFMSHQDWIAGYWARFDREPAYRGWREHVADGDTFMKYIGPTWVGTTPDGKAEYVRKVLSLSPNLADVIREYENGPPSLGGGGLGSASTAWGRLLE